MTDKDGAPLTGNDAFLAARKQIQERNDAARAEGRTKRHARDDADRAREAAVEKAARASNPSQGRWIG